MTHAAEPDRLLEKLATDLENLLEQRAITRPLMVGIQTGGVWLADKLHRRLKLQDELATLDISFYRDDFSRIGMMYYRPGARFAPL